MLTHHCYIWAKMRPKVKELLMLTLSSKSIYKQLHQDMNLLPSSPHLRHNGRTVLKKPCTATFCAILILCRRKTKQQNHGLQGQQFGMFQPHCSALQTQRCRQSKTRNVFRFGDFFGRQIFSRMCLKRSFLLHAVRNGIFCYYFKKHMQEFYWAWVCGFFVKFVT